MSIDQKIKELLHKKKKIDYLKYIADILKNDTKCVDFNEVKDEVLELLMVDINRISAEIENDEVISQTSNKIESVFSDTQIEILKTLADRASGKTQTVNTAAATSKAPVQNKPEMSSHDKMNFALSNRHLASKRVQVLNDANTQIFGTVVGLDAPYVIVKTEAGATIQVPLEKINIA